MFGVLGGAKRVHQELRDDDGNPLAADRQMGGDATARLLDGRAADRKSRPGREP